MTKRIASGERELNKNNTAWMASEVIGAHGWTLGSLVCIAEAKLEFKYGHIMTFFRHLLFNINACLAVESMYFSCWLLKHVAELLRSGVDSVDICVLLEQEDKDLKLGDTGGNLPCRTFLGGLSIFLYFLYFLVFS